MLLFVLIEFLDCRLILILKIELKRNINTNCTAFIKYITNKRKMESLKKSNRFINISLWANVKDGEYCDKKILETEKNTVWNYCGQKSHKNDYMIRNGALFFLQEKKLGPRIYQGTVKHFEKLEQNSFDGSYRYFIIVEKDEDTGKKFRIKSDAFRYFNLCGGNICEGIIGH